jgi:hypothetical protein
MIGVEPQTAFPTQANSQIDHQLDCWTYQLIKFPDGPKTTTASGG